MENGDQGSKDDLQVDSGTILNPQAGQVEGGMDQASVMRSGKSILGETDDYVSFKFPRSVIVSRWRSLPETPATMARWEQPASAR